MKKIMWGLFQTAHSKTPHAIFHCKGNAETAKWIKAQVIKRLEIDFKEDEVSVTARLHTYSTVNKIKKPIEQTMVFLNGSKSSFRCECGANVFTKFDDGSYECNSCKASYKGQ